MEVGTGLGWAGARLRLGPAQGQDWMVELLLRTQSIVQSPAPQSNKRFFPANTEHLLLVPIAPEQSPKRLRL